MEDKSGQSIGILLFRAVQVLSRNKSHRIPGCKKTNS